MSPLSVLWPVDETGTGYVFGWNVSTIIVVAGVHNFTERADAVSCLNRANELFSNEKSSSPLLEIIGVCSQEGYDCASHVDWDNQHPQHIFYYRRPKGRSWRHYSLVSIDLDMLLAIKSPAQDMSLIARNSKAQTEQSCFVERRVNLASRLTSSTIEKMNTAHGSMSSLKRVAENGTLNALNNRETSPFSARVSSTIKRNCQFLLGFLSLIRTRLSYPLWFTLWSHTMLASAQQLDLRCEQLIFILRQTWLLGYTEETSNNELSSHYISTQNCIWLILNDIIIGSAVGIFLVDNRISLAKTLHKACMDLSVDLMRAALLWLDNWPAGLKLNTELSQFLYLIFNALLDTWEVILKYLGDLLPIAITLFGISGALGMTMILACLSDLTSILTTHLSFSYTIVRIAYRTQLLIAHSLFNLFRGKRYNTLRRRLDDWDYDLDQLLLGAMLLTLINFLFPTVTVYYVIFALARLVLLILQAVLQFALALLNHFPLFALTLRLKDPWRLPGGIIVRPYRASRSARPSFVITNLPIALSKIFSQYSALCSRLASHYNPTRLIASFFKGNRLDPIPQSLIRYTYGTNDLQGGNTPRSKKID